MVGNNELVVNNATMKEIVQQWVDKAIGNNTVVASVSAKDSYSFSIVLSNEEKPSS